MAYDIIGDIHGQADKLEALLRTLGYRDTAGAWRHAERRAIFVGDFIDRGPAQVRSVISSAAWSMPVLPLPSWAITN